MKMKTQHFSISTKSGSGYSSESSSSSPPSSPRRLSRGPHYRRCLRSKVHSQTHHRESFFSSVLLRCNVRLFLLLPLFYFSGLLMCVGTFSALLRSVPPIPGSVYRSPEIFRKLWPEIQSDNASAIELSSVWKYRRRLTERKNCSSATTGGRSGSTQPSGYLIVEANGGLNQQRSSICNAVAVAGLLNAVLVIPQFQFHSVWRDPSGFGDIYDEDHFITTLRGYVTVVRELPEALMERYDNNMSNIPIFRAKAWAPASYYLGEVYPILQKQGVIRISPFANRLAMEVPSNIQYLRCLANYEALRFSTPIAKLAKELVNRMIKKSSMSSGKYVSIHLRFEEDMVAFSCCVYDGGKTEKLEMDSVREKGWRGKFKSKNRVIEPGINRINGRCPLTPLEVGMMLWGMGFDNTTSIFLASGKIYQAERNLAPLLKMFPLLQAKDSLATKEELASFEGYSSKLAALDYTVCLFSEVFVTTQGGNFPHFLMGHRRFLYNGHAKTIKPDKQKLVFLLQDTTISWKSFKEQMKLMRLKNDRVMVTRTKKSSKRSSIYSSSLPECWCLQGSPNFTVGSPMLGHQLNYLV
ncbi:O-fucosyltransferase 10 [Telopea speciosissima]|uniref:O-fucosyltransferase 10 n=1 Tax=Telopea speciosissima TaxID=54955 RepID=UPI001CC7911B|nr:O-fucosyltransferase 10 [Telopea speciosissima]